MKTQLVLFAVGSLGVASAICEATSRALTDVQRRILKNYFAAPVAERSN
jgi:hypothetical protein